MRRSGGLGKVAGFAPNCAHQTNERSSVNQDILNNKKQGFVP
jgi:hypothetical protein